MYLSFPGCCPQAFTTSKSTGAGLRGPSFQTLHQPATQPQTQAAPALTSLALFPPSFPQGVWKERPLFPWKRTSWIGETVQTATFGNSVAGGEDQELWNRYFKQFLFPCWYLKWLNSNKANRSKLWGPSTRNRGPECPPVSTYPEPTRSERVPVLLVVCGVYCKKSQNIKWLNGGILPAWEQAGKQFKEQKNSCLWRCPVFLSVGVDMYVSLGKMMAQAGCLIGRWLAVRSDSRL